MLIYITTSALPISLRVKVVLNSMSEVEYPLKRLSIYVESISEESMSALCNECNGIHIGMLGSYVWFQVTFSSCSC